MASDTEYDKRTPQDASNSAEVEETDYVIVGSGIGGSD